MTSTKTSATAAALTVTLGLAASITITAGFYEFTLFKQFCRRCCENVHSGFECGLYCVGSCIGLMLMQVVLGVMSVTWMAVIAVLVVAQKLLPMRAAIDVDQKFIFKTLGICRRRIPIQKHPGNR